MKKIVIFALLLAMLISAGCKSNVSNTLPPLRTSGDHIFQNGTLVYEIFDSGKKKGEEKMTFQTVGSILKVQTSISLATVYLDKNTLLPEKIEAKYIVNKTPSYVKILFEKDGVKETIERSGKTKNFTLPAKYPMYPDDVLHFILQGSDFNFSEAYIYDFFPYTSLEVPCIIKNIGKETIEINKKTFEAYHIVADFGKKKRDYWISEKTPHLLLKREENGVIFILKSFSGN